MYVQTQTTNYKMQIIYILYIDFQFRLEEALDDTEQED